MGFKLETQMKRLIKKALRPVRKGLTRIVLWDQDNGTVKQLRPIYLAADFVCTEYVPGDYLEFGTFRGSSFITAYHSLTSAVRDWSSRERAYMAYSNRQRADEAFLKVKKNKLRFFAFDSFQGLPEPVGIDNLSARFSEGRYDCTEEEFREILANNDVDLGEVIIVPGFYEDTLTDEVKKKYNLTMSSIVMIDCDLYESTGVVLDFITDLVVEGTVLIFDDWFSFKANPNLGEQRACKEWLEKNPQIYLTPFARWGVTQQSFIVHRKDYVPNGINDDKK